MQNVFWRWFGPGVGRSFDAALALSVDGIQSGQIWTLITYSFMHSMRSFFHLLVNGLAIFFIGRELLPLLGSKRFLWLYGGGVVGGGLLWLAVNWTGNGILLGASAGAFALFTMFAALYPNRSITLLIFFVIPITIKPKWAIAIAGGIDLLGFLFYELAGSASPGGVAHSAHLGGMAAGWIFFRYVHNRSDRGHDRASPAIELPAWLKRTKRTAQTESPAYKVNVSKPKSPGDLKVEVDRILDKINSQGFGSLTSAEKKLLDDAKDLLSRR